MKFEQRLLCCFPRAQRVQQEQDLSIFFFFAMVSLWQSYLAIKNDKLRQERKKAQTKQRTFHILPQFETRIERFPAQN